MADIMNDNELLQSARRFERPDAHGQAALLLVESLIYNLIEQSVIRVEDAIDVVTVAIDVEIEIAAGLGDSEDTMDKALGLLSAIRGSLSTDAP